MKLMSTAALAAIALFAVAANAQTPEPAAAAAAAVCANDAGAAPPVDITAKRKVIEKQVADWTAWRGKRIAELECRKNDRIAKRAALKADFDKIDAETKAFMARPENQRTGDAAKAEGARLQAANDAISARNKALITEAAALDADIQAFNAEANAYFEKENALKAKYGPKNKSEKPAANIPAPKAY
jgi:cell division protein FtsB